MTQLSLHWPDTHTLSLSLAHTDTQRATVSLTGSLSRAHTHTRSGAQFSSSVAAAEYRGVRERERGKRRGKERGQSAAQTLREGHIHRDTQRERERLREREKERERAREREEREARRAGLLVAHSHTSSSLCWDRHRIDGKINSSFLLARLFAFMDVYGTFFFKLDFKNVFWLFDKFLGKQ